jgi:hypothetical protein
MSADDRADRPGRGKSRGPADSDPLGTDDALANLLTAATPPGDRAALQPPQAAPPGAPAPQAAPAAANGTPPAAATTPDSPATASAAQSTAALEVDPLLTGPHTGQATVAISVDVARRFRRYQNQRAAKGAGQRPSNGEIVFAALNASKERFAQIVAERQPKPEAGQLFGAPVPGRRTASGAQPTQQLSFRPTPAEKALIARLARESGAASMAAFLNAVLDDWLARQGFPPSNTAAHT